MNQLTISNHFNFLCEFREVTPVVNIYKQIRKHNNKIERKHTLILRDSTYRI